MALCPSRSSTHFCLGRESCVQCLRLVSFRFDNYDSEARLALTGSLAAARRRSTSVGRCLEKEGWKWSTGAVLISVKSTSSELHSLSTCTRNARPINHSHVAARLRTHCLPVPYAVLFLTVYFVPECTAACVPFEPFFGESLLHNFCCFRDTRLYDQPNDRRPPVWSLVSVLARSCLPFRPAS
jgi:hypothetical protein